MKKGEWIKSGVLSERDPKLKKSAESKTEYIQTVCVPYTITVKSAEPQKRGEVEL